MIQLWTPWRKEALLRGFRSSISFPVKINNQVVSLLTMYSSLPNYFTNEQIGLLLNVSENISFALQAFHIEGQRKITQARFIKIIPSY